MEGYFKMFLTERKANGCTPKTIQWHRSSLGKFRAWAEATELSSDPAQWTVYDIREFVVSLQESELSSESVATFVRSVRAFLRWLHEEEFTSSNLSEKVRQPKSTAPPKKPFSAAELQALYAAATNDRDKAILALLLDCGLRANELCQLERNDIDFEERSIMVRVGKGGKYRVVPFSARTGTVLRKCLLKHSSDVVFPSRNGGKLTPNGLLQAVIRMADRAGIEGGVGPHRIRHTFALGFLKNGGDPLTLQRILGHATLEMTTRYVNQTIGDISAVHDAASPATRMLSGKGSKR